MWKRYGPQIRAYFGADAGLTPGDWATNAMLPYKETKAVDINNPSSLSKIKQFYIPDVDVKHLCTVFCPESYTSRSYNSRNANTIVLNGSWDQTITTNSGGNYCSLESMNDMKGPAQSGSVTDRDQIVSRQILSNFVAFDPSTGAHAATNWDATNTFAKPLANITSPIFYKPVASSVQVIPILSSNAN